MAFRTAPATSGVAVPTFGFGIRPRGPRIWPRPPTTRIASGLATTTSKSIWPAFTFSARSSRPTMSAPASRAASAFFPCVKTATRTFLPVPFGITVEPRTCWSDLAGSMPRLIATSTVSSNFAFANSLTSASASSTGYAWPGLSRSAQGFWRLKTVAMSGALHVDAHAAGAARDGAHGRVEVGGGQVRHLLLRDLLELLARDPADLLRVRRPGALLDSDRLAHEHGGRRRLQHEGEGTVAVHRDDHGDRQALLLLLRRGVELLAEFHDVHALLAERGPDRRARVRPARRDLQLDVTLYFLGHRLNLFHLPEVQLDRRRPAENLDRDLQAALLVVHVLDQPREVVERAVHHAHDFAGLEQHLRPRLLDALLDAAQDGIRFLVRDRRRLLRRAADEAEHLRRLFHEVPRLVAHRHLYQHVAGEELALALALLAGAHLDDFLGRDRKSTRLNSSHSQISYAVFCLKKNEETPRARTGAATACECPHHVHRRLIGAAVSCTRLIHQDILVGVVRRLVCVAARGVMARA